MQSPTVTPGRVLVLDDHAGARDWLTAAVREAFPHAACVQAATVREARERIGAQPFDLALLDLKLPDGSGLDLLGPLQAQLPSAFCVVATIYDDDEHLFTALQRGAQGYVLKEQSRDALATMLRAMVEGQPPLSPAIARRLLRQFAAPAPVAKVNNPLTPRESEALALIGKGFSVAQAAAALAVSHHTAHDYVRSIYRKLAIASRAEAAIAARELGLA